VNRWIPSPTACRFGSRQGAGGALLSPNGFAKATLARCREAIEAERTASCRSVGQKVYATGSLHPRLCINASSVATHPPGRVSEWRC